MKPFYNRLISTSQLFWFQLLDTNAKSVQVYWRDQTYCNHFTSTFLTYMYSWSCDVKSPEQSLHSYPPQLKKSDLSLDWAPENVCIICTAPVRQPCQASGIAVGKHTVDVAVLPEIQCYVMLTQLEGEARRDCLCWIPSINPLVKSLIVIPVSRNCDFMLKVDQRGQLCFNYL